YTSRNAFTESVRIGDSRRTALPISCMIAGIGPPIGSCRQGMPIATPHYSGTMSRAMCGYVQAARVAAAALVLIAAGAAGARAQTVDPAAPPPPPAEIELNIINLPTTKSLARHGSYFRLTHRFARDLRRGDFGQLAEDLFALDNGAIIGLEYRFGITSDLQAGVHRSILSRTIEMFGRYDRWRQNEQLPVSI